MSEPRARCVAEELVYESDWLASRPLFYNVKSGAASHNINEVIDLAEFEFDPEGFNDYLDFGFSVFEHSPVRDVRLLRHSARLFRGPQGLHVEYLDDPASGWLDRQSTVDEVFEVASAKINEAAGNDGEIVVPTSGGLDSRLLDSLVGDRSRVRAFTYGVSDDPRRSLEAVKARELVRRLGIRWELIPLGYFHHYLADWDALFGISTHAHGMYQMEFYRRVLGRVAPGNVVLSGACGEWFAGDDAEVRVVDVLRGPDHVLEVFRYGRMCADSRQSCFKSERLGARQLLEDAPGIRTEMLPRVLTMVRLRMQLLSYLLRVPASLGLRPQAPFIDIDLALRMLTLPAEQRLDRRWQREFFARQGVDLESEAVPGDRRNTLNFQAMRRVPLEPLDVDLLREVVRPEYVRWINHNVGPLGYPWEVYWRLNWTPGFRRAVGQTRRFGLRDQRLPAYAAYLTLRPIQQLLRRRERFLHGREAEAGRALQQSA